MKNQNGSAFLINAKFLRKILLGLIMSNIEKRLFFIILFVIAFHVANAQNYALPFRSEDLKGGERIYTGNHKGGKQGEGEDFGMRRYLGNNKWSSLKKGMKSNENSSYLIYGMPVYAIADGTIIGCWCNAPENPRPKERHAQKLRIPGGGNELWVKLEDGSKALYAHMIPGTIPKKLCPNKDKLFPKPKSECNPSSKYVNVPRDKQVKIKKGQFLGRVGNSGSSSGPHLHLHIQKNGRAVKMRFKRGLYKKYANANLNEWKSFAGKKVPDGKVLIWPPRKVTKEYVRHGYPAKSFQRLFDHLVDSGYELEWLDGYSVGERVFFNFVWKPKKRLFRAYFGLNASKYQSKFAAAKKNGYVPTMVDSYTLKGKVYYNVIFKKTSVKYMTRHGLTFNEHKKLMNEAKKKKLSPINISVVSIKSKRLYTVLYHQENISNWQIKSQVKETLYQKYYDENKKNGRSPIYLNAYKHNGEVYLTTVFAKKSRGVIIAKHGLSRKSYQISRVNATKKGYRTKILTAIDGAKSKHRFTAIWRK